MILALDVYYWTHSAKAVGVLFNWTDFFYQTVKSVRINHVDDYVPGQFYLRELPCLLKLIDTIDLEDIATIVVDGHVFTSNDGTYGLGGHLWKHLQSRIPVIGVAKSSFQGNEQTVIEVYRGDSSNPLYVSSIGIELSQAAQLIKDMSGSYRIPSVLKALDQETKRISDINET